MPKRRFNENSELFYMVQSGSSLEDFEEALRRYSLTKNGKADLRKCRNESYVTILSFAIQERKWDHVNSLLKLSEVNLAEMCKIAGDTGESSFRTPLHHACRKGNFEIIKKLVEKDENLVKILDLSGDLPINQCIKHDNMQIFRYLYEKHQPEDIFWLLDDAIDALAINIIIFILFEVKPKDCFEDYDPLVSLCEAPFDGDSDVEQQKRAAIYRILYNFQYPETQYRNEYDFRKVFPSICALFSSHDYHYHENLTLKQIIDCTYLSEKNSKRDLVRAIIDYGRECREWILLLHDEITVADVNALFISDRYEDPIFEFYRGDGELSTESFLTLIEEIFHIRGNSSYSLYQLYTHLWSKIFYR